MASKPDPPEPRGRDAAPRIVHSHRRRDPKRSNRVLLLGGGGLGAILLLAAVVAVLVQRSEPAAELAEATSVQHEVMQGPTTRTKRNDAGGAATPTNERLASAGRYEILDATDPQFANALWQPPTAGAPIKLIGIPSGAKCVLCLNFSSLNGSSESQRAIRALGPKFNELLAGWSDKTGVRFEQLQNLLLAWFTSADGNLDIVLHAQTRPGWEPPSQWQPLKMPDQFAVGKQRAVVRAGSWTLASAEMFDEIKDANGPPILSRQLESLRKQSDADRQINLLVSMPFLWSSSELAFGGGLRPVFDDLELRFGDDIEASLVSLHVDEAQCYLEFQSLWRPGPQSSDTELLQASLTEAIKSVASTASLPTPIDQYWGRLRQRMPVMLAFLQNQLRTQREGRVMTANISLPPSSLHNLALGTELLLAFPSQGALSASAVSNLLPAQILNQKVSYSLTQESLVTTVKGLESELRYALGEVANCSILLDGEALKTEGITRNQQIKDFDFDETPLRVVMTELVKRANPGKATATTSPAQRLVWAVEKSELSGNSIVILITTRKASKAKGLKLSPEFAIP